MFGSAAFGKRGFGLGEAALSSTEKPDLHDAGTGTLGKAVAILDIVAAAPHPLRFTEILNLSDQPRGTLHRNISNLVQEGLLTLKRDHTYELGLRLLVFASRAWSANEFRVIAEPHLRRLHEVTGETVHLGILRGTEVVYLDKFESRQTVRMYSQIGNASPAYCTGVGKAALSALPQDELDRRIGLMDFHRFTDTTITSAEMLKLELSRIRQEGRAFDREEHEAGIRCVAAPIFNPDRSIVAGISVTGPAFRATDAALEDWTRPVREAAAAISRDVGARLAPRS
ncbi:MAG TPA: IclR family transcriptional regulator [Devosiaceae bacterium]